jgi:hypothetical protein
VDVSWRVAWHDGVIHLTMAKTDGCKNWAFISMFESMRACKTTILSLSFPTRSHGTRSTNESTCRTNSKCRWMEASPLPRSNGPIAISVNLDPSAPTYLHLLRGAMVQFCWTTRSVALLMQLTGKRTIRSHCVSRSCANGAWSPSGACGVSVEFLLRFMSARHDSVVLAGCLVM